MDSIVSITRAFDFAARCHCKQVRKGEAREPYINHIAEVAALLAEATDGGDPVLVIAGILHDTVEDTEATLDDIRAEFGDNVAEVVAEVTDDKSLPSDERKAQQVAKIRDKSNRAKLLKMADKTSNLRSILISPPSDWTLERKRDYFRWGKDVTDHCRGLNARLEAGFDAVFEEGRKSLGF